MDGPAVFPPPPGLPAGRPGRRARGLAAPLLALLLASHLAGRAAADLYLSVTIDTDASPSQAGSLRAALEAAQVSTEPVTYIYFNLTSGATIALVAPFPPFTPAAGKRLEVDGALNGSPSDRVTITTADPTARLTTTLANPGSTLSLSNLRLQGLTFKTQIGVGFEVRNCWISGAGRPPGKAFFLNGAGSSLLIEDSSIEDHTTFKGNDLDGYGGALLVRGAGTSVAIRRTTFLRNRAVNVTGLSTAGGAGIFVDGMTSITLEQVTVMDGYANRGGAFFIGQTAATGLTIITNCTFQNNIAVGDNGGALVLQNMGPLIVQGNTFRTNKAITAAGGALIIISAAPGARILENSFTGNFAGDSGGAVYVYNAPGISILDNSFTSNAAAAYSGCIHVSATPNMTVQRSTFTSCTSNNWGGAIYVDSPGFTVDSSSFDSCRSNDAGGAIFSFSSGTTVTRTRFTNCYVPNSGGCLWLEAGGGPGPGGSIVDQCTFTGCSTQNSGIGGGLFAWRFSGLVLTNSNFTGCSAGSGGGAYFSAVPGLVMSGISFQSCNATNGNGGGLYIDRGWTSGAGQTTGAVASNVQFTNCNCLYDGGGAYYEIGNSTLTGHTYTGCTSSRRAGGAYVWQPIGVTLSRMTFSRCVAAAWAGGVHMEGGYGNAVLDSTFSDNNGALFGGGLLFQFSPDAVVSGVTFVRNVVTQHGGGLYMDHNSNVKITNVYGAYNNAGSYGGGLYLSACTNLAISNLTLFGTTAYAGGGVMFWGGSGLSVTQSSLRNCSTTWTGGGLHFETTSNISVTQTTFTDCFSPYIGGGIRFETSTNAVIDQCTFTRCSVGTGSYGGGGVFFGLTTTNARITRSAFQNCTAPNVGGGLAFYDDPRDVYIGGCTFTGCASGNVGGGLYFFPPPNANAAQHLIVEDSVFVGNTAAVRGGGMWVQLCPYCELRRLTLANNVAGGDGGAGWIQGPWMKLSYLRMSGNRAGNFGGGIVLAGSSHYTALWNLAVWGNVANHGGGIFIDGSNNATLTQSDFSNNTANIQGGGTILRGSSGLVVTQCTFNYNGAANGVGGGLWIQSCPSASVSSCTMAGNTASDCGGGLFMMASPSSSFTNLVISRNAAGAAGGICQDLSPSANLLFDSIAVTGNSASGVYPRGAGGVFLNGAPSAVIQNLVIDGNTGAGSGGLVLQSCDGATVTSSVITNNAGAYGGGAAIRTSQQTRVAQILIQGNKGSYGVGMYVESANRSVVSNVTIRGSVASSISYGYLTLTSTSNSAFDDLLVENNGGALAGSLYSWSSTGNVHHRNIWRSNTALSAPGFLLDSQADHTFYDSVFTDNSGPNMGSLVIAQNSKATLVRSLYARNGKGGTSGIAVWNGASLVVRESTLDSNSGSSSTAGSEVHVLDASADIRSVTIAATAPLNGVAIASMVAQGSAATASVPPAPAPVAPANSEAPAAVKAAVDKMATVDTAVVKTPPSSAVVVDDNAPQGSAKSTGLEQSPGLALSAAPPVSPVATTIFPELTIATSPAGSGSRRRLLEAPGAGPSGASASATADWTSPMVPVPDVATLAAHAAAAAANAAAAAADAAAAVAKAVRALPQAGWGGAVAAHAPLPPMPPLPPAPLPAKEPTPRAPIELPAHAPAYERAALAASGRPFTIAASDAAEPSPVRPASHRRHLLAAGVGVKSAPASASVALASVAAGPLTGSAIFLEGASDLNLVNSIVACPNSQCLSNTGTGTATVKFSLLRGAWGAPADGNIDSTAATTRLGPLQDNGGPTFTRLPDVGSPSIDAGSNALLLADGVDDTDQRGTGFPRIACSVVDMGAVEAPARAPTLYAARVPAIFNTTRNNPVFVAAPGVIANVGPFQQFAGSGMSAVLVTGPASGTLDLQPSGAFNYTPARDFVGTDSFTVLARRTCSGTPLDSPPATFYVYVRSVTRPPVLAGFNLSTNEDTPLRVPAPGVLAGASDPDGDSFSVVSYSQPGHGSVVVTASGAFNYTPALYFSGLDSFTFNVSDAFGGSTVGVVFVNVAPVNHPPSVRHQNYTTAQDTALSIPAPGVLLGATDIESDPLTASLAGPGPVHGTLLLRSDGGFTYTPDAFFSGSDSFKFTVSDGKGGNATATAFITVGFINYPPYAIVSGARFSSGTPTITIPAYRNTLLVIPALGLLPTGQPSPPGTALFGDPENGTLTLTMPSPPGRGSATFSPSLGVVTYKPPYMKKDDGDIITTLVLRVIDTGGLWSPLLTVNIVVGAKPPLGTPSINALAVRLTGCSAGGVNIDTFSVTSGKLTLLDKSGSAVFPSTGTPTGLRVQAVPKGAPWPIEPTDNTKVPCIIKAPGKVASEASRSWDYGSCGPCLKCLTFMGFNCSGSPLGPEWQVRIKAYAQDNAAWASSMWSAPFTFRPTCEGQALTCFR